MENFFTYMYFDPRISLSHVYDDIGLGFLYEPFYVGKGKGNRHLYYLRMGKGEIYRTTIHQNSHCIIKRVRDILNDGFSPFIIKIADNLLEKDAFSLERKIIEVIGTVQFKKGSLLNWSMGGEGCSAPGHLNSFYGKRPEKAIEASVNVRTGKNLSPEHKEKVLAPLIKWKESGGHTEESKRKIGLSHTGDKHYLWGNHPTEEHRESLREGARERLRSEIQETINVVLSLGIPLNERSYTSHKIHKRVPKWSNILKYYSSEEFTHLTAQL